MTAPGFRLSLLVSAALLVAGCKDDGPSKETIDKGRAAFVACQACHGNDVGPSLQGVIGRQAATVEGYDYSDAMRASGITWSEERLVGFILDTEGTVPGTYMAIDGIDRPTAEAIVAYIKHMGG